MDLTRKQSIAQRAIESISQHYDEPVSVVHTELDKLTAFIASEKAGFAAKKSVVEAIAAKKAAALAALREANNAPAARNQE